MKDYNRPISYESLNNFVQYANDKGYTIEVIEGVLNDTYVIYNINKQLSIKGVKGRDYIVLYPQFLNEWSNNFHILMTDDEEKVDEFLELAEV
jgi:hypothetical protein